MSFFFLIFGYVVFCILGIGAAGLVLYLTFATVAHRRRLRTFRRAIRADGERRAARTLHVVEDTDAAFEAELAALLNREGEL
ncbi:hypothetical protein ACIQVR_41120 [Streptomyces xanthochromogenes]|uniref:hypothetical protein n=1 Tax=Streptomyces xanthochromogenes TaxID=67384 RepID=UPI00381D3941